MKHLSSCLLVLFLLCSPLQAAITYVGAGAATIANNTNATAVLHVSTATNDLILVAMQTVSNAGVMASSCPSGYTQQYAFAHPTGNVKGKLCSKIAGASETNPQATVSGGSAGDMVIAQAATFRGINTTTPVNVVSGSVTSGFSTNIGPITAITPTAANGAIIVVGHKGFEWLWTVDTLTGDSQTWAEIGQPETDIGTGGAMVWDYAIWTGAAPTITGKTFVVSVTNGGSQQWCGGMLSLNAATTTSTVPIIVSQHRRRRM